MAGWQRDLSVSHTKLGEVAEAAGDTRTARAEYRASLEINARLAVLDPGNAAWRSDLRYTQQQLNDLPDTPER